MTLAALRWPYDVVPLVIGTLAVAAATLGLIARRAANGPQADHTLHQSAALHLHLRGRGHYSRAVLLHLRALDLARLTGHRGGEQYALYGLGHVHYAQGRYGPATDCFEQALDLACQSGDRNGQFEAHQGLGRVDHATQKTPFPQRSPRRSSANAA